MTAYSTRYAQAAASQNAARARRVANQNVTTSQADVDRVRAEEGQRRAEGKEKARTP